MTTAATYTGPEFYTVKAISDRESAVIEYTTQRRIGTYPHAKAQQVAKNADDLAMKEHLKALRKARKASAK